MKPDKQNRRVTIYIDSRTLERLEARRRELSREGFVPTLSQIAGGALRKGLEASRP